MGYILHGEISVTLPVLYVASYLHKELEIQIHIPLEDM